MAADKKDKQAVLVIVVGFALIGLLSHKQGIIWTGAGIGALALLSKQAERGIVWVWMKIAEVLGYINSKILLSLTFYVILVPMSVLKKLFSKTDSLQLKAPEHSAWTHRDHLYTRADMEDAF